MSGRVFAIWLVTFFVVLATVLGLIVGAVDQAVERECHNVGGHRISTGRDHLCISPDGRVIEP